MYIVEYYVKSINFYAMKKWTTAVMVFLALTEALVICAIVCGALGNMAWAGGTLIAGGVTGWVTIFALIGEKIAERKFII